MVFRQGIWACLDCGHSHTLRIREDVLEFDRYCRSCQRRCRQRLDRARTGQGHPPTVLIRWRPRVMPWHALRAEMRNRNDLNRRRRAQDLARDHGEALESWDNRAGFRTASSIVQARADRAQQILERQEEGA